MSTVLVYRTHDVLKVAKEFRRHGIKTLAPGDRSRKRNPFNGRFPRTAPGYVFPEKACHAVFEKHACDFLGVEQKAALASLYVGRPSKPVVTIPVFDVGDMVRLEAGPFEGHTGTVTEKRKNAYVVDVGQFPVSMNPQHIRRITAPP